MNVFVPSVGKPARVVKFATIALALGLLAPITALTAGPAAAAPGLPRIVSSTQISAREMRVDVQSPAMGEVVELTVLLPKDRSRSRGTVYLLDGAGKTTTVTSPDWITKGHADTFFADKNVNVVIPVRGAGTFFSDWQRRDARLGKPMWETFLTRELPPLIDRTFNGNGRNVVMGLSMGGQSAMSLLASHPSVYTGAASFSGCPTVNVGVNPAYVYLVVGQAGGDATNMWGPVGGPDWRAHDPSTKAGTMRGKNIYMSAGTGVAGPLDRKRLATPGQSLSVTLALGDYLERAVNACTRQFDAVLTRAGVAHTSNYSAIGTHSWPYWAKGLYDAWPVVSRGL